MSEKQHEELLLCTTIRYYRTGPVSGFYFQRIRFYFNFLNSNKNEQKFSHFASAAQPPITDAYMNVRMRFSCCCFSFCRVCPIVISIFHSNEQIRAAEHSGISHYTYHLGRIIYMRTPQANVGTHAHINVLTNAVL